MSLPPFRLERFFARYEFSVEHLLCASDCETLSVAELLALEPDAERRLLELRLGYTESSGEPELREAIAGLYDTLSADDVLVFSGGQEAIYALMQVAIQPPARLFVHSPCYQSLHEVARARGCRVVPWRGRESDGWALDPAFVHYQLLREGRRQGGAVVINCPHNPTGWQMTRDELEGLARLTDEEGLLLVSDVAYRFLEPRPEDRLPGACDLSESAVSLGVASKAFGLPGLRIGWLASHDRGLLERLAAFKDYQTICTDAVAQNLAALALRHAEEVAGRNRRIVAENLALLRDFMARRGDWLEWAPPGAGCLAYPGLAREMTGEMGANAFCARVLERSGVLLLPGSVFDESDHRHLRIGFGRKSFPEGLARLDEALDAW
jgi:aspartate/methionine/tyrosine aminotransferase